MKIGVIVPSLRNVGPVIVAKNIAEFSQQKNLQFIFISLRKNEDNVIDEFKKLNLAYFEIGMNKFPLKGDRKKIIDIIKSINPSIIHTHGFWPDILASQNLSKYKLVTTIHNNPVEDYSYQYGSVLGKIMVKFHVKALSKYDKIVGISHHVKDVIIELNRDYSGKIEVIYNGIEDNNEDFKAGKSASDIVNLLSVGMLNKVKNIETAIRSVACSINMGQKVRYTVIGDGRERNKLERLAYSLKVHNNIKFEGKKSRKEVFSYYKKCDALIFPSLSEGLGLVAIEAQMMGKPVIGSNISAMKEIVNDEENGFICEALNEAEFAEAIGKIAANKNNIDMYEKSRKNYLNKFQVTKMCKNYEELYKRLV